MYVYCGVQVHILYLAISRRLAKCVRGAGPKPNAKFRIRWSVKSFFSAFANPDDSDTVGRNALHLHAMGKKRNFVVVFAWLFARSFFHP